MTNAHYVKMNWKKTLGDPTTEGLCEVAYDDKIYQIGVTQEDIDQAKHLAASYGDKLLVRIWVTKLLDETTLESTHLSVISCCIDVIERI